jgi:NADH-quinone oxidoreductase subunit N
MNLERLKSILDSFVTISPELFLVIGAFGILFFATFKKNSASWAFRIALLSMAAYFIFATAFYNFHLTKTAVLRPYDGLLYIDKISLLFKQMIAASGIITLIHIRIFKYKFSAEIYFLIICILLGLVVAAMSTHFMVIFLSLELSSLATYVLVFNGRKKINYEAAIKYFVFGCVISAIMLYGISFLYGIFQTLDFKAFSKSDIENQSPVVLLGLGSLVLALFFFKTAAFPLHSWLADVYEATETPFLSFLSFAPKALGFLLIGRMVETSWFDTQPIIIFVSIGSLIIGNVTALRQNNSKRLLGFSGIAQTGFILLGFLAFKSFDFFGAYFYILSYLPISAASFWLVDSLYGVAGSHDMRDYVGLGQKNILLAINAVVIMVALVGLPPTIGFTAKLVVFSNLLSQDFNLGTSGAFIFVLFGLLNIAISIYYYLRMPYFLLVKNHTGSTVKKNIDFGQIILTYLSVSIIYLFLSSQQLAALIEQATN